MDMELAAEDLTATLADTGRALVLCIDDELIHLSALSKALDKFCDVHCAGSAEEAEPILVREVPDIVLLDMGLPGKTGDAFCRRIRGDSAFNSTRIIILSAYSHISDRLRAYAAGADDYVIKPFSADEIAAKIRVFYRLISAERQLLGNKLTLEHLLSESVQELKKKFIQDEETDLPNGLKLSIDMQGPPAVKTVILLNINAFARINETYGFKFANEILHSVAMRLRRIGDERGYAIYRMRGADFAFLRPKSETTPETVAEFLADIHHEFCADPVRCENFEVPITFNAGIALNETEDLLRKAALALDCSKGYGRGQHGIFSGFTEMKDKYRENFAWGKIVKNAVSTGDIVPYFQGIHNNISGSIEKYECLVRIRSSTGLFMPQQFLPAASKLGLLTTITREMIRHCFAYFYSISPTIQFGINIVEEDLVDDTFLSFLEREFRRSPVRPEQVIFEIVETASIAGRRALRNLEGIKRLGCMLALDDFGTENSNFARILNLKVDFIKIDGRYIRDIHRSQQSFIVAKTITNFAHSIGARAVAEFVHCPEVQLKVAEINADFSQGYLIHRPAAEVLAC